MILATRKRDMNHKEIVFVDIFKFTNETNVKQITLLRSQDAD